MRQGLRTGITMGALLVFVAGMYLAGAAHLLSPTRTFADDTCQTFAETGHMVCGDFLAYWQAHGGLAQQGFPISDVFEEKSETDGKTYKVQYFERAVFEAHPENQPPYTVLLSLLGTQKYKTKYPAAGAAPAGAAPAPAAVAPPAPSPTAIPPPAPAPTLVTPTTKSAADVTFTSIQGAKPGNVASVTVQTAPNATCAIRYATPKGTGSVAQGLAEKTADANGYVTWSFLIGGNTTPGTGTVTVTCNGTSRSASLVIG